MTLQEAINTGKNLARAAAAAEGDFMSAAEFLESGLSLEDYNATDYVVETVSVEIPESLLIEAWNNSKPARSVAIATESDFYTRFKKKLTASGIVIK